MKKSIILLLAVSFSLALFPLRATAQLAPSAECAALYDAENRIPLYTQNADARHAMASTTKIMTALVAYEQMAPDTVISVAKEAVGVEGSSVYLEEGDRYTLTALLYALLLQSANDAAEAIAYAVSGSIEGFADLMNEKAAELGLTSTHFDNPHGLDSDTHYTTANELAVIACALLEVPLLYEIVSTHHYTLTTADGEKARSLINHNKLLYLYEGSVGVKTGFTKRCGRCLVSAAKRDGLLLVAVTLDAPSDWEDHRRMLDYGFRTYESRVLAKVGDIDLTLPLFNAEGEVHVTNAEEVRLVLPRDTASPTPKIELLPSPVAPLKAGDIAGYATYTAEGRTVTVPLVYAEDIQVTKPSKGWFGFGR